MFYIERDGEGNIISLNSTPRPNATETKTVMDEEVLEFLRQENNSDALTSLLEDSDIKVVRIVEDLIDLLIHKNLIFFTELPEEAQERIRGRKKIREKIDNSSLIVDDIL